MPRRGNKRWEAGERARIRVLLRNPDFQDGFNELRRVMPELPVAEQLMTIGRFQQKWGLSSLARHPGLFQGHDNSVLNAKTIPRFESILTSDVRSVRLFEKLIRSVTGKVIQALRKRGYRARRQHLKKVDFSLQVYDFRQKGKTFKAVANEVGENLSTVKMAYRIAERMILGSKELQNQRHWRNCKDCQSGRLCEEGEALIDRIADVSKGSRLITVGSDPEVYRKRKHGLPLEEETA